MGDKLVLYVIYLILAAAVVLFSVKCAKYVDWLDKMTSISGAFIGGVILAAVTSLPELFTSISATMILGESELVMGNILGSDIFNLAVIAVLFLVFIKGFPMAFINRSHLITTGCSIICYIVVALTAFYGFEWTFFTVSSTSVVILILYILSIRFMAGDQSEDIEEELEINLSLHQVIFRFIIMALLLIAASILITFVTDEMAEQLQLGVTLAGALFLGVATSLPELSSCIALCKVKNYNAALGNIVGSNVFNFFILVLADLFYWKGSIYVADAQTLYLTIFGLVSSVCIGVLIFLKTVLHVNKKLPYILLCVITTLSYFVFLLLSSMFPAAM